MCVFFFAPFDFLTMKKRTDDDDAAVCSQATAPEIRTDIRNVAVENKNVALFPDDVTLQGSPPLYSYSVITVDSSPAMSWIHHRMPVSPAWLLQLGTSLLLLLL